MKPFDPSNLYMRFALGLLHNKPQCHPDKDKPNQYSQVYYRLVPVGAR